MPEKLSPHLLTQIGRIVVTATLVEKLTAFMASVLMNRRSTTAMHIFLSQLSWRQCVDISDALAQKRLKKEEAVQFRNILARAESLMERRNRVVHSLWSWCWARGTTVRATRIRFVAKKHKGFRYDVEFLTLKDVKCLADAFDSLLDEYQRFVRVNWSEATNFVGESLQQP